MASVWFRQRALKGPLTPFQDRVKILPIIVGFGDALLMELRRDPFPYMLV